VLVGFYLKISVVINVKQKYELLMIYDTIEWNEYLKPHKKKSSKVLTHN